MNYANLRAGSSESTGGLLLFCTRNIEEEGRDPGGWGCKELQRAAKSSTTPRLSPNEDSHAFQQKGQSNLTQWRFLKGEVTDGLWSCKERQRAAKSVTTPPLSPNEDTQAIQHGGRSNLT